MLIAVLYFSHFSDDRVQDSEETPISHPPAYENLLAKVFMKRLSEVTATWICYLQLKLRLCQSTPTGCPSAGICFSKMKTAVVEGRQKIRNYLHRLGSCCKQKRSRRFQQTQLLLHFRTKFIIYFAKVALNFPYIETAQFKEKYINPRFYPAMFDNLLVIDRFFFLLQILKNKLILDSALNRPTNAVK